jgi:hypothetical protein
MKKRQFNLATAALAVQWRRRTSKTVADMLVDALQQIRSGRSCLDR